MMDKFREGCLRSVEVGERHHRGGRRGRAIEEHRELVDEVANGGLASLRPVVNLRRKEMSRDLQLAAEITHLFRFGFKVLVLRMGEDKVEHPDAPLNVFNFVFPAVAKVLPVDLSVKLAREDVIDLPVHWEVFRTGVFFSMKLVPESGR